MGASSKALSLAVTELLRANGTEVVFGIPGGKFYPLLEAWRVAGLRPIVARHESAAAYMAAGYAQASGKLGVVFVLQPGAFNAVGGVASAYYDQVPLLVLATQNPRDDFGRHGHQETTGAPGCVDSLSIFNSCAGLVTRPPSAESAFRALRRAIRTARASRRPSVVEIYADLWNQKVTVEPSSDVDNPDATIAPSPELIASIAASLAKSELPTIVVGEGFIRRGAATELAQFCTDHGIAVVTTETAKGAIPEDHPMVFGVLGRSADASALDRLERADWLLLLGVRLGSQTTLDYHESLFARAIQVDSDAGELGHTVAVDRMVVADPVATFRALAAASGGSRSARPTGARRERPRPKASSTRDGMLQPATILQCMREILPRETLLVTDTGTSAAAAKMYFPVYAEEGHFSLYGLASMGAGLPLAHGVQIARRDASVLSVIGDGGFLVHASELHTAAENSIPVIHLVFKNNGYACVADGQREFYGGEYATRWGGGDFAGLARSLGCDGYSPKTQDELATATKTAVERRRPCVIEVDVDPNDTIFNYYHPFVLEYYRKLGTR